MSADLFQAGGEPPVYVNVTPLVAGSITLPEHAFISPSEVGRKSKVPCMCFVVEHPRVRFMFDLGLRAAAVDYVAGIQQHLANRQPVTHRPSAPEILRANNIDPAGIQTVILSHVHWDHHGDPTAFPNATFYVGAGSVKVLTEGLPGLGSHSHFDPNLFDNHRSFEFRIPKVGEHILLGTETAGSPILGKDCTMRHSPVWQSLGPFPFASDLYGDGSVFLVPAPGHLPGHVNLLCRIAERKWVYLGGDAYHDARLLTGEKTIATWEESGRTCCVHVDREEAMASISRIGELKQMLEGAAHELEVIVAHDAEWYSKNEERCMTI